MIQTVSIDELDPNSSKLIIVDSEETEKKRDRLIEALTEIEYYNPTLDIKFDSISRPKESFWKPAKKLVQFTIQGPENNVRDAILKLKDMSEEQEFGFDNNPRVAWF